MSNQLQSQIQFSNSLTQYKEQNKLIGEWIKNEAELQIAETYYEKRIGDFDSQDLGKLVVLMGQWRLLLGVTSDPNEQELVVICQFIYDNFKKFTLSDVRLAMNWTISGKVDVGFVTQKNISSYYISRALNAYEEEKRRIYNQLMYERDKHLARLKEEEKPQLTPLEKANSFKEYIVSMYRQHKAGSEIFDLADMAYNWLKRTNQICQKNEVIDAAVKYGKEKYLEERRTENKLSLYSALDDSKRPEREKKLARNYMVMYYFDTTSIQDIMAKIKPEDFTK